MGVFCAGVLVGWLMAGTAGAFVLLWSLASGAESLDFDSLNKEHE